MSQVSQNDTLLTHEKTLYMYIYQAVSNKVYTFGTLSPNVYICYYKKADGEKKPKKSVHTVLKTLILNRLTCPKRVPKVSQSVPK